MANLAVDNDVLPGTPLDHDQKTTEEILKALHRAVPQRPPNIRINSDSSQSPYEYSEWTSYLFNDLNRDQASYDPTRRHSDSTDAGDRGVRGRSRSVLQRLTSALGFQNERDETPEPGMEDEDSTQVQE